ncbi:MAG: hypothetical protein AAGL90_03990 [Pseudomonadota bacterium]
MITPKARPHHGGHIGLTALLSMLLMAGCVALAERSSASSLFAVSAQTNSQPSNAVAATFIVRFHDDPTLAQVSRNFRRDQAGTSAVYRDWAANHPQLSGLSLVRASYSGELILALPANDPAGRTPQDVIAALRTMPNLAYAEIDEMATTNSRR